MFRSHGHENGGVVCGNGIKKNDNECLVRHHSRTSFLVLTIRALRHLWDTLRHLWVTLRHFGTFFWNIETLVRRLEQLLYFHTCSLWLTSKTIKLQWLRFFHPTDQKEKWSHVEQIWYQSLCFKWLKKIGDTLNNIIYFEKCSKWLDTRLRNLQHFESETHGTEIFFQKYSGCLKVYSSANL